ncbi:MAG: phosphatidylglycerol lysyltransferase domain-containing protein [Mycobacteriales bacterium]
MRQAVNQTTSPSRSAATRSASRSAPARRRWAPGVAAFLTAVVGVIDVVSALTPEIASRMHLLLQWVPGAIAHAAAALTLVIGVLLLLIAHGLRRRKQRAWRAATGLLALSVVLNLVKGLDVEEAAVSGALLGASIWLRNEFRAAGDPRSRWVVPFVFVGLLGVSVGLGMAALAIRHNDLAGSPSLSDQLDYVFRGLIGVSGALRFRSGRTGDLVGDLLGGLGFLTVLLPVYLALRPPEPLARLGPEDEAKMRELLTRHGRRDSLGYFALRRDKSVIWSATGKSAISYRVVSGVMLASGDPLGDPEAWPGAIQAFLAEADRHAWTPAVIGCSELGGAVWARTGGLSVLELGDEAVVDVAEFALEGRAMRNVRQAVARVERAGYSCRVRRSRDIDPEERARLRAQAAAWREADTERGFSMALGRIADPADGDCVVAIAEREGRLGAFLHFVPWGCDGLSLDLMRRDRDADNGLNELLIVSVLRAAPELGVCRISLNFAAFRSALERGERLGAGPIIRAWRALLVFISRWFQIESLYRFNAKFRPYWEPRYICYPTARDLPRVAIAALEAEAFVVWPRPTLRRLRRLVGITAG